MCWLCWPLQIKCTGVDYESSTYEDFLDLSLEINRAASVIRALQFFTAKEILDGDNKYRCPKNNKLVSVCDCTHAFATFRLRPCHESSLCNALATRLPQ